MAVDDRMVTKVPFDEEGQTPCLALYDVRHLILR